MNRLDPDPRVDASWWLVRPDGAYALPTDLAAKWVDECRAGIVLGSYADAIAAREPVEVPVPPANTKPAPPAEVGAAGTQLEMFTEARAA